MGAAASVDLFWLPFAEGGHSVSLNGRVHELVAARVARRGRHNLYRSVLEVPLPEGRFVVEQAPVAMGTGDGSAAS